MIESIMSQKPSARDGDWQDEAECRKHDSRLWLLSEEPDDRYINQDNFKKAEVICSTCPVFQQCWDHATDSDKAVTMRSGAWPELYIYAEECKNGHDTSKPDARTSNGACRECRRMSARAAYRAAKDAASLKN